MTAAETGRLVLPERGVLAVTGEDRRDFLQGLVSNDVMRVSADRAIYAAFLTAQGKFLHDFLIVEQAGALLLDCEAGRREDLRQRLRRFRLRAKVEIEDRTEAICVGALFGPGAAAAIGLPEEAGAALAWNGGTAFVDPRLAALGARAILPRARAEAALAGTGLPAASFADYDAHRLALGVPDGSRDMPVEKAFLLENNIDELNGIAWQKGCYVGQELTARTKYRGLVRKRLLPVRIEGPAPEPGAPVLLGDRPAGELRSSAGGRGLALLRLDRVEAAETGEGVLTSGAARLTPIRPDWLSLRRG